MAEAAHPDANIIFGAMVDEKVVDQVWVTVVATGYGDRPLVRSWAPIAPEAASRTGRPRAARVADRAGVGGSSTFPATSTSLTRA